MRQILDREAAFAAISTIIVVILGTQFVVGLVDTGRWGWPMVAYPMYKTSHYDGERFDEYDVFAVLEDGTRTQIQPADLGMSFWIFRQNVADGLLNDRPAKVAPIIARYCENTDGALAQIEVLDRGLAISTDGLLHVEPQVVKTTPVRCQEGQPR
jgi:hypothetical protein